MRILTLTWNCETDLGIWYHFYRERFPSAKFTIYDNQSSDYTPDLAKEYGIDVITFDSKDTFDDRENIKWKNQDFKDGWVIFGDVDELVQIDESVVYKEKEQGTNIFRFKAYDMFEKEHLLRNPRWDKSICWNSSLIKPNFTYGAHECRPKPIGNNKVVWSFNEYQMIHNKYKSEDDYVKRSQLYAQRFESWNKGVGHGKEYFKTEEELRKEYRFLKEKALKA